MKDLRENMIIAEDVTTMDGTLLVGKGQEATPSLCERLRNFARNKNVEEPLRVLVPAAGAEPAVPQTAAR